MEEDQLQELVRKCFTEGGPEEWKALRAELKKPENALLREELFRFRNPGMADVTIEVGKMWKQISTCRHQGKNRRVLFHRIGQYVALLAVAIGIGGISLWIRNTKPDPVAFTSNSPLLEPGHRQAILKLVNGERIELGAVTGDTLFIREEMTIQVDATKSVFYGGDPMQEAGYNTITVPRGGEYHLVLGDGSVVWLNSDSELKFPAVFSGAQRKVFLKGEAYFDVVKNPSHPFIVQVADMEVKVLGTQFNVNVHREDGVFQTTLVCGKVRVSRIGHDDEVVLAPDQQALLKDGHLAVRHVDASAYTAWRNGKFYFEAETLLEIVAQLERWYNVDFFFTREELKYYEFTGVIRRDYTANQILDIIAKTTNVGFEIKGHTILVR